jgi:hypothetical protein
MEGKWSSIARVFAISRGFFNQKKRWVLRNKRTHSCADAKSPNDKKHMKSFFRWRQKELCEEGVCNQGFILAHLGLRSFHPGFMEEDLIDYSEDPLGDQLIWIDHMYIHGTMESPYKCYDKN